jgi:hypothetical protein
LIHFLNKSNFHINFHLKKVKSEVWRIPLEYTFSKCNFLPFCNRIQLDCDRKNKISCHDWLCVQNLYSYKIFGIYSSFGLKVPIPGSTVFLLTNLHYIPHVNLCIGLHTLLAWTFIVFRYKYITSQLFILYRNYKA